ncbi:amidohydrolase family protein [Vibrio astriarenae]
MFKKTLIAVSLAMTTAYTVAAPTPVQETSPTAVEAPQVVVFKNVNVFNGTEDKLYNNHSVVVTGNKITAITKGDVDIPADAEVIDGEGRTLMPALIDAHMHLTIPKGLLGTDDMRWTEIAIHGQEFAEMYLDMGFGTIRDVGGADGSWTDMERDGRLKEVPRIYASGAPIAPIGSHADVGLQSRRLTDSPQNLEILNIMTNANGVDDIKMQARYQYRQGAQFTKVFQSGGVSSKFDPWQYNSYLDEEMEAAVAIAESYGSYVATQKFNQEGAFIATNLTAFSPDLATIPVVQDPLIQKKLASAQAAFGTYQSEMKAAEEAGFDRRAFNVDCVGTADTCAKQIAHEIWLNADMFGNFSALRAMTSTSGRISAELMQPWIDPYSDAKLGVIEVGAYADILLVDGNPLEDITLVGGRDTWFGESNDAKKDGSHLTEMDLIMKDGKVFKNTL